MATIFLSIKVPTSPPFAVCRHLVILYQVLEVDFLCEVNADSVATKLVATAIVNTVAKLGVAESIGFVIPQGDMLAPTVAMEDGTLVDSL